MKFILQPIRFTTILVMIVIYLAHMGVVWVYHRDRWRRVRRANELLSSWVRAGLWVLNVRVQPLGLENLEKVKNGLFVGNHLSYLDVLVIASRVPACFVTSLEIKRAPVLGQICQISGCLFVDRKSRVNLRKEVGELTEGLDWGVNIAIFPEATSTNGEQILRFRRPLYMSAVASQRPVVPFCLNYRLVGGAPINPNTRDKVFWYGDMSFAPHLWAMSGAGGIEVDLHFLSPIEVSESADPTQLAEQSQRMIEKVFLPVRPQKDESSQVAGPIEVG